jgi:hypothetical protein
MRTTTDAARRLLVAAVLTGLGLTMAACNDGGGSAQPATQTVTVGNDSGSADSASGDTTSAEPAADGGSGASGHVGTQLPDNWPDDNFPIPPGVTVQAKGQDSDEIGIVLVGSTPDQIATFYRSALPAAGYQVTEDNSVSVGGRQIVGLKFNGHGYNGELAVVTGHVAISLEEV